MKNYITEKFIKENVLRRDYFRYGVKQDYLPPIEVVLYAADKKQKLQMLELELDLEEMREKLRRRERYNKTKAAHYATVAAGIAKVLASTGT